jgi:dethiobiotin synthetase
MKKGFFITGTDTNVGKTWATIALMHYFKNQGESVVGMKPVASGCLLRDGQLKNEDALLIQENASLLLDYELINPYAYEQPISPHIAGLHNPVEMDLVLSRFDLLKNAADIVLVEGAGGWYSPLNAREANSDLAKALALPVIMIVAIRLGCINHARLTYQAIVQSGSRCSGWIGTCTDPDYSNVDETLFTLKADIDAPLLGVLPYNPTADFGFFAKQIEI